MYVAMILVGILGLVGFLCVVLSIGEGLDFGDTVGLILQIYMLLFFIFSLGWGIYGISS